MYIVQIKNPMRFSWKKLPVTKCEFEDLDEAIKLYRELQNSKHYVGMDLRIWSTESDHGVEF